MVRYRERLWPSLWVFLAGALILPAMLLVFAPISPVLGIILGIALYVGYAALLVTGAAVIEVTDKQLRVGSARVPLQFTGAATANSTRASARQAAGPSLDARAWLCLRGWVVTSAKVQITDADDPVPYWLFSTRRPDEVCRAIAQARQAVEQR